MRACVIVTLLAATAAAGEGPADKVLAAFEANDAAALAALAGKDDPDPWLVADELLARGRADAAEAFALAAPRKATEALPGYVRTHRGRTGPGASAVLASLNALNRNGDYTGALKAAEEVRASLDTVTGVGVGYAVARALRGAGRPDDGRAKAAEAAAAAEALGWLRRAAWCRMEEGSCINDGLRQPELVAVWEKALLLADAGGDRRLSGILLESLGEIYRQMRRFSDALASQEKAARIAEESGDLAGLGISLGDIGSIYIDLGDLPRALAWKERALPLLEEAGERVRAARTVRDIGTLRVSAGDPRGGLEDLGHALRRFEEAGDQEEIAGTWINIGNAHESLGDPAKAFACQEEALRRMEELGNTAGVAMALGNVGNLYRGIGDASRALGCYEKALRLSEEAGRADVVAANLGNLAAAYCSLGDPRKALSSMEEALKVREGLGQRAWVAITLDNIGVLHRALGDPATALACAERARAVSEEVGDRNGVASALANAGRAHKDLGEREEAVSSLEKALALQEEVGDDEGAARTRWALCSVHGARRDYARAAAEAKAAALLACRLGHGLADELQASKRDQFGELYGCGAFAAAALGDPAEVAFFLETGRAGALLESLRGREALRTASLPPALRDRDLAVRGRESAALAALRHAVARGDLPAVRQARTALDAARTEAQAVADQVQREAKAAAHLRYASADPLATIQGRLGPRDALVLYGVFPGEDFSLALVVTTKGTRIVPLGKAKRVEEACAAIRDGESGPAAEAALRRLVLDPLEIDAGTSRLLVSPDGALSYVPFGLLSPDREITYVPSGTTYGILLDERDTRGEGVLALGDPDYAALPGARALRGGHDLARLPATAAEAEAVGDVVLLGKAASEPGLREAIARRPRWRAVHFACHGLVDPERPMFSSLALTPAGDDDGYLTALDVLRMRVPADLAVLSACETGKGRVYAAEGIVGLVRAFLLAGTPRVLVSLWKVDDEATRALMQRFYATWKEGAPAARALRDAQEFVRGQERWRHPRYWAAWSLWGLPE